MTLAEKIVADQLAVTTAQADLDAANAQLKVDETALLAVQPALDLIGQLETLLNTNNTPTQNQISALLEQVRVLLTA